MVGNGNSKIEQALRSALERAGGQGGPPRLQAAMRAAVFPGGARLRPRLTLACASACRGDDDALSLAAAASIELLHCASLVHDDLPCFDNASTRRGQPAVHCAFGQPLAILAGDALIVAAFEALSTTPVKHLDRLPRVIASVAASVGAPNGIAAGQAWECESEIDIDAYHRAKTGALFSGALAAGALSAGADPTGWHAVGDAIGLSYQTADDLRDVVGDPEVLGKPVRRDAQLARPNAVAEFGFDGALRRLENLFELALDGVPACQGRDAFRSALSIEAGRILSALCPRGVFACREDLRTSRVSY